MPSATPSDASADASQSPAPGVSTGPRNVVVVLLDSLNRHMLGSYGGAEFATPHLDRFAATRATRFTNHVTGSLPCMPARHDILCGALDFLWKPWGSIELWERPVTADLRAAGVTTMLVSDHPHLFETGGENYHTDFVAWDYVRGHEGDPWRTHADTSWVGTPAPPARDGGWFWRSVLGDGVEVDRAYDRSRTFFRAEDDYPGPRTMAAAARWLRGAAPTHDRFLLFVDEFDPHEPFDTPAPWLGRYEDEPWDGDLVIWPPYVVGGVARGVISPAEARHIRANYGAKLSMIDHWFGEVLSALDDGGLWDDTAVIVCTDHGHYLGDARRAGHLGQARGAAVRAAGPRAPARALARRRRRRHVRRPDDQRRPVRHARRRVRRDPGAPHARRLAAPARRGPRHDDPAVGARRRVGQLGAGHRRPPQVRPGARPLPTPRCRCGRTAGRRCRCTSAASTALPPPDDRAVLDRMPGSTVPVIRQPFAPGDMLPFWAGSVRPGDHHLYDVSLDPDEAENRVGEARAEGEMRDLLRAALDEVQAPDDQFARLGLT